MDQVHVIRHKVLVEGQSIRSVAKEMSVSRNTISKYLKAPEPKRVVRRRKSSPVMEMVAPRIEELLEEWKGRTTPKQRITGSRIHRQLLEEGYQVGITTVRDYLRERRRKRREVFVPLVHRPDEEAQVDFFEVTVEEGGQTKQIWKVVRACRPAEPYRQAVNGTSQPAGAGPALLLLALPPRTRPRIGCDIGRDGRLMAALSCSEFGGTRWIRYFSETTDGKLEEAFRVCLCTYEPRTRCEYAGEESERTENSEVRPVSTVDGGAE